jgi:hypothetical protein
MAERSRPQKPCPICNSNDSKGQCLFTDSGTDHRSKVLDGWQYVRPAKDAMGGIFAPIGNSNSNGHTSQSVQQIAEDYIYLDAKGQPYLKVSRYYKDGKKQFAQSHCQGDQWIKKLPQGFERIPYRLLEVIATDLVLVVEGEKDCNRAKASDLELALGAVTTTNPQGAGKWPSGWGKKYFTGKTVVIIPDNDQAGAEHSKQVAADLAGYAASVRVLHLSGLPPKGDLSDFLDQGGTVEGVVELVRKKLAAPPSETDWGDDPKHQHPEARTGHTQLNCDLDYTPQALEALEELNHKYALIKHEPQGLWDIEGNKQLTLAHLRMLLSNQKGWYRTEKETKPLPLVKLWESWSGRREHDRVDIVPEQPTSPRVLNLWQGWGGSLTDNPDASLWTLHLDFIFALCHWDGTPTPIVGTEEGKCAQAARSWFEQWIACPIQKPGEKLRSMVLLWSSHQGVGKTAIADLLHGLYASHFIEVDSQFFESGFNGQLVGKLLLAAEEIHCQGRFSFMDRLKPLITSPRISINVKHGAQYEAINRFNLLATSNHANALYLDPQDRRVFVWEIQGQKPLQEYFDRLFEWGQSQEGKDSLFTHLKKLDLSGFDPHAEPPSIPSKQAMIDAGRSDLDRWIEDLESRKDIRELISLKNLLKQAKRECELPRLAGNTLSAALNKAGIKIKRLSKTYNQDYVVCIRNWEHWQKQDLKEWARSLSLFTEKSVTINSA